MNRLRARAGSALLAVLTAFALMTPAPVPAADGPGFWFAGTRLILARTATVNGDLAVAIHDPGFAGFLGRLGATVAWQPGERYVVFTAADRHTVSFTLGDPAYRDGTSTARAPFAAYADAGDVYVPFTTVARALYVQPVTDGADTILQPQLGALDVRQDGVRTIVALRGATPLRYKKTFESGEKVVLVFSGLGSSLAPTRQILTASLSEVDIVPGGNARNPTTTVTFDGAALSIHALYPSGSGNEITVAFAPQNIALAGTPIPAEVAGTAAPAASAAAVSAVPPPVPSVAPSMVPPSYGVPANGPAAVATAPPTTITAVDVTPNGDGATVKVTFSGPALYEWHRLADGRWYADFRNVSLASAPTEQQLNLPAVQSVRVRQIVFGATPVVRVALTLNGSRAVRIDSAPDGSAIVTIDPSAPADVAMSGAGQIGAAVTVSPVPLFTPAVPMAWRPGGVTTAEAPMSTNPRLIVIDPGHGGSDTGAMHNGLVEKVLTLDISMRLRTILTSRGWTVKMTRERDVDVVAPDDDARTELQGRCDVANNAGARLFVSVHINAFTTSDLNGTTTYYYKPGDETFAEAVQHRLIPLLGTKDDGVKHENLYVVRHTTMPAILVETAFLSNPDDAAKLRNPAFLQNVAEGIADGIGDYAGSPNTIPATSSMSGE
jgi:N-acetylmuramoyl-L-alanine amidase CwlD